jgi:hypothetical protein
VNTGPFALAQPSGEANETGTATISKKETAINAKRASWNKKIINVGPYKTAYKILKCLLLI